MSAIEDKLGIPMQVCSGCLDSYADSIDNFFVEEETRFYLPLKEYIGFCDSLKTVVRRHELLQNQLEKMEETVSSKAEARNVIINSNPETSGGQKGKRFTFKNISARLRGEDTSYEGQLAISEKELQDSEVQLCDHQKKFDDFNENAIVELEKFNLQKFGDFRSMLVNYVQLQMHIHKKGTATWQKVKEAFNEIET
jgi:sorting nexin-4